VPGAPPRPGRRLSTSETRPATARSHSGRASGARIRRARTRTSARPGAPSAPGLQAA
jgi:hypothetical protein